MLKGLHHIGVMTPDIDRSVDIYETIGLAVDQRVDMPNGTRLAFMSVGSLVIELIRPRDVEPLKTRAAGIVDHIAIEVEDIDTVVSNLIAKGIQMEADKAGNISLFANGSKNIFFAGPGGERLELFEEL